MKKFIQELRRRNVIKSALAYLVVAWLLTQVMAIIIPAFELPTSFLRTSIIILSVGFPFWLLFSWIYEFTPEGVKKTKKGLPGESITGKTSNRLKYVIIASLIIVTGLFIRSTLYSSTENEDAVTVDSSDKSIAVLAFADMSPEKDQEYFSDGISEEILNLLTKVPGLKVISRTSSFSYKGKDSKIKNIGKELHVEHILEGSVRKSGSTFRVTAQLIDAKTGAHIWSEAYDRNMEDIFKIQDEIATKVTQQLKISLLGTELTSTPIDTDAYHLFLQATELYNQNSLESNTNAFKLIRESMDIDSLYAPAWGLLSKLYYDRSFLFADMPIDEGIEKGKPAARKAIALDPSFIQGYLVLAQWENASWKFKEARKLLEKVTLLDPNHQRIITFKSDFAYNNGKVDLAIELMLKKIELDPLNDWNYYFLGLYYWSNSEFGKAEESLNQYLLLHPNSGLANGYMGMVQINLGHPEKALEYIEKDNHPFWNLYRKSMVVYALGNKTEANVLLKKFITDWGEMAWPNVADVYAFRGDRDEAFKWLDLALENKDISLLEILNYPEMQNLWGDPRWNNFIDKLGLPEDHGFHLD